MGTAFVEIVVDDVAARVIPAGLYESNMAGTAVASR